MIARVEKIGAATRGYIISAQSSLFGQPDVIGFGDDAFCIREVPRDLANEIIRANHYSRKTYNASYLHLGVVVAGELLGILQFGYAMNPASASSVVSETELDEYLELNRMWLDDRAERCSESRALSYAIKFIRRKLPKVKWIQSFADERCGRLGVVYQASGFRFYGEHIATFWSLDGVVFHNSLMTRDPRLSKAAAFLQENKKRATSQELRQFRYLYFMAPRFAKGVKLREQPFPKPSAARPSDECVPTHASDVQPVGAAPIKQPEVA
jgi:hypothetical protein